MSSPRLSGAGSASKSYDFVLIGGSTAGLVLAARLSEDFNISVGIVEAGEDRGDDPLVQIPGIYFMMYEKPDHD